MPAACPQREVWKRRQAVWPQPVNLAYDQARKQAASIGSKLELLLKNGTPAGRLYAAFIIDSADHEAGKKAFASLKNDTATLNYKSGCEIIQVAVYQVADQYLNKGKYLDFPCGANHKLKQ